LNDGQGAWLKLSQDFGMGSEPIFAFTSEADAEIAIQKAKENDRDAGIKDSVYEVHPLYEEDEHDAGVARALDLVEMNHETVRAAFANVDVSTSAGQASIPVAAEETSSADETTADDVLKEEPAPPPAKGKKGK